MSRRTEGHPRGRRFAFTAVQDSGGVALGELWAPDEAAAREQLARRRLLPLSLAVGSETVGARRAPATRDLAVGLRVLASLLDARLPLDKVIAAFATVGPAGWPADAIEELRDRLREGRALSTALRETFPGLPSHIISIVGAGEESGSTGQSCALAAQELETVAESARAVRAALAYPVLLAFAGSIATAVLVGIVLPRFAGLLAEIGQALPWSTRTVLALATAARLGFLPALAAALVGSIAFARWRAAAPDAARRTDAALLRIPIAGAMLFTAAGARVAGTLAGLLRSGVPLPVALPQAGAASGNAEIVARVADASDRVVAGERLSRAFALADALPPSIVQLLRAGEESGDVPTLMAFGARLAREQLQERVSSTVRIIEPALILLFGGVIAIVAAALLQAIYAVRPA